MAKQRIVNTKFWDDSYIADLDPIEKLLFLYLLTNPLTNISGVYEIQLRRIAFDTGIDKDMVLKILTRFENDEKVVFLDDWVAMLNFAKHQTLNPSVIAGIERELRAVPSQMIDRLPPDCHTLSYLTKLNLTKPNLTKLNLTVKETPSPKERAQDFFSQGEVFQDARQKLLAIASEQAVDTELSKFSDYWTEKNSTGTKQRWQMQKTFEVEKRLGTWLRNVSKFTGTKSRGKQIV